MFFAKLDAVVMLDFSDLLVFFFQETLQPFMLLFQLIYCLNHCMQVLRLFGVTGSQLLNFPFVLSDKSIDLSIVMVAKVTLVRSF